MTIEETWLVQRLESPYPGSTLDQPFSTPSGLPTDAQKVLGSVFTLDYMGSSEFEFGIVGKTLRRLAGQHSDLRTKTIEIDVVASEYEKQDMLGRLTYEKQYPDSDSGFRAETIARIESAIAWQAEPHKVPVYIIAPEYLLDHAAKFIARDSLNSYRQGGRLKEFSFLRNNLLQEPNHLKNVGWLELDNGFMFFTDKTMFERTATVLGIEIPPASPIPTSGADALRDNFERADSQQSPQVAAVS